MTSITPDGHITWTRFAHDFAAQYIEGYTDALSWLKTCPPASEAREIDGVYTRRREDDPEAIDSTFHIDADKIPTLIEHVGLQVADGAAYKDEMVLKWPDGGFEDWDPPKRMVSWPGAHAWFEGFEQAVAHVYGE